MKGHDKMIPEGWEEVYFGNIVIEKPKSRLKVSDATGYGNFPFFTSGDAILLHNKFTTEGENILLATGGVANVKFHIGKIAYSTDTYALTTKETTEPKYLYYSLLGILTYINNNYFQGSGLKHLQKRDLREHCIVLPKSLSEQKKIAEILSTADKAIEQTEKLIAKYQRIKTGLMQDLLTNGIDENGNIRSEETHEFKDSPLGRIPVQWECDKLDSFLQSKQYGVSIPLEDQGITPILRMNNIEYGECVVKNMKYSIYPIQSNFILNDKDVLFNRTNSIEHVGKTGIFRIGPINISFASYLVRLIPKEDINAEYFNSLMNYQVTQNRIKTIATSAVHQANVNPTNLGNLYFSFPKIKEQETILGVLKSNELELIQERKNKSKLQKLKTGLMQDLLSGKVRVNDLITDEV